MKILIKLEELAQFLFSIYLFSMLPHAWWVFPLFIFAPDVSLIGLAAGRRIGAITYNLIHHKALALTVYVLGGLLGYPLLSLIGVLLLGHSSFDRMVGFTLMDVGMQVKPVPGSVSQSS